MQRSRRTAPVTLIVAVFTIGSPANPQPGSSPLFSSHSVLELRLRAPLRALFQAAQSGDTDPVPGTLVYTDEARLVTLDRVDISVRGHTSKDEAECSFPKLRLGFQTGKALDASLFAGNPVVKIGTHCGERGDAERTPKGRLANELAPLREAFVYRLLDVTGIASFKARPARIEYDDPPRRPLLRNAVLLEDVDEAIERLGAEREIEPDDFTTARELFESEDAAKLAFAEALIGNFDWCVKFTADDTYRCDARERLWNVTALARGGKAIPLMYDFDIAGMVAAPHGWFSEVFTAGFAASGSQPAIEVIAQLQRTRSLFNRRDLDATRDAFLERKEAAYRALGDAVIDPQGKETIKAYMDAFFTAIAADEEFYRPVFVRSSTAWLDADRTMPACGAPVPPGTPVSEPVEARGAMMRVYVLDALWRWAMNRNCDAMRRGPVWVDASAVSVEYPER